MNPADSAIEPEAFQKARRLLTPPTRTERVWPVLAAAAFAAVSAMGLAFATILAPPAHLEHMKKDAYGDFVR